MRSTDFPTRRRRMAGCHSRYVSGAESCAVRSRGVGIVALLRVVLVAAVAARPHGVRGTPAADVRRYVAMDTTMTDVSTVMRSMPTPPSDARIQASMTIPLSKTRSRASRKLVRSAVRSTGIAYSVFQARSSDPPNGARSAPPTEGQPFSSALSMEQTISRMRIVRSLTSAIDDAAGTMPCPSPPQ